MTATEPLLRVQYTERKVEAWSAGVEQWQRDHRMAMECRLWEELIRDANQLFDSILRLDRDIRMGYSNGVPYDEDVEKRLTSLVGRWSKLATSILPQVGRFEKDGYDVDDAQKLRKNIAEASGILMSDDEFFADDLSDMQDKAVEAHRSGKSFDGLDDQ